MRRNSLGHRIDCNLASVDYHKTCPGRILNGLVIVVGILSLNLDSNALVILNGSVTVQRDFSAVNNHGIQCPYAVSTARTLHAYIQNQTRNPDVVLRVYRMFVPLVDDIQSATRCHRRLACKNQSSL